MTRLKWSPLSLRRRLPDIPCLVLTHGTDDINTRSLNSIIECDHRLSIDVIHNPSATEDGTFIEMARDYASSGKINSFTVFDENISNNAFLLFLEQNKSRYSAQNVILTDGDILAPAGSIDEQIAIFEAHPKVFACGVRIDANRWTDALPVKSDLVARFNTSRYETKSYVDSATGMWMAMFRGPELIYILDAIRANGRRLTDGNLKHFGAVLFQKRWVATKNCVGRELNRERPDYYLTKSVSISRFGDYSPEPEGSSYATWNHNCTAPANQWKKGSEYRVHFPPLPTPFARFRDRIESDPVVQELTFGSLKHTSGYLAKNLMQVTEPGLAFIVADAVTQTGFPHLPGGRSVLFVSKEAERGEQVYDLAVLDLSSVLTNFEASVGSSVVATLRRFVGAGGTLRGTIFLADVVREELSRGNLSFEKFLPDALREVARGLVHSPAATGNDAATGELFDRIWSDMTVARALGKTDEEIAILPSTKYPFLGRFACRL